MPQFKVYSYVTQDRSGRVRWMLEELGLTYENQFLDHDKKEHLAPEILAMNPLGRIPILQEGGKFMQESCAICLYLADRYAQKGLAPALDSELRASYLQWSVAAVATLEQDFFEYAHAKKQNSAEEQEKTRAELIKIGQFVSDTIEKSKSGFLVGSTFTTADLMIGSTIGWSKGLLLEKFPVLRDYQAALKDRPACIRSKIFASWE